MISTNYARRAIIMSNIIDLQEFRFTKQTIYTIIFIIRLFGNDISLQDIEIIHQYGNTCVLGGYY